MFRGSDFLDYVDVFVLRNGCAIVYFGPQDVFTLVASYFVGGNSDLRVVMIAFRFGVGYGEYAYVLVVGELVFVHPLGPYCRYCVGEFLAWGHRRTFS